MTTKWCSHPSTGSSIHWPSLRWLPNKEKKKFTRLACIYMFPYQNQNLLQAKIYLNLRFEHGTLLNLKNRFQPMWSKGHYGENSQWWQGWPVALDGQLWIQKRWWKVEAWMWSNSDHRHASGDSCPLCLCSQFGFQPVIEVQPFLIAG